MNKSMIIAATASLFVLLLAVERLAPLRKRRFDWLPRLVLNLALSGITFAVAAMLVRPTVAALIPWGDETGFGLLRLGPLPGWARFVAGFLLMDLSFYYWHVANHKIPFLWRFHNVHHYDPDLDVTTGFRFHFGEVIMSVGFRAIQVTLIGVTVWTYAIYELVFQANTLFHHSNVRLPIRVERALNWILVTPRMHGIHHSQVRDETNSNYSVVFSWWDRLHRTIGINLPQEEIVVGVPAYSTAADNRFWSALRNPFQKQRDYWRSPEGGFVATQSRAQNGRQRLAE